MKIDHFGTNNCLSQFFQCPQHCLIFVNMSNYNVLMPDMNTSHTHLQHLLYFPPIINRSSYHLYYGSTHVKHCYISNRRTLLCVLCNKASSEVWHIIGFAAGVANMVRGGGGVLKIYRGSSSQNMGGTWGSLKCCQKYLSRSSFDSKVASYKPASLQIY